MWIVWAVLAAVLWGVNYAASGRILSRGMSPTTLYFIDASCGMAILGTLLLATGRLQHVPAEIRALGPDKPWLLAAIICTIVPGVLIFMAIQGKNATVASLIEISYPLFVALFAWLLFREAHLNPPTIIGGLMIIAGVIVISLGNK